MTRIKGQNAGLLTNANPAKNPAGTIFLCIKNPTAATKEKSAMDKPSAVRETATRPGSSAKIKAASTTEKSSRYFRKNPGVKTNAEPNKAGQSEQKNHCRQKGKRAWRSNPHNRRSQSGAVLGRVRWKEPIKPTRPPGQRERLLPD